MEAEKECAGSSLDSYLRCAMAPLSFLRALTLASVLCAVFLSDVAALKQVKPHDINAKRHAAAKRFEPARRGPDWEGHLKRRAAGQASTVKNITFTNPKASGAYIVWFLILKCE